MRLKTYGVVATFLLCGGLLQAQMKSSGSLKCSKPNLEQKAVVGPDHVVMLDQEKCVADPDKALSIDGVKSGNAVSTVVSDVHGSKAMFHGYYMDTLENGDKAEYSFHGTGMMKDGVMQSGEDSWTLVHVSGKLQGTKGKGTCKSSGAAADGSVSWDCEGEYTAAGK
jgi:hypothetical protein